VKWATFSPWLQWNRPISVKKGISLIKSVFFSPIIILFLQYSRKRSSHVPYRVWCSIFYSKLVNCILFKIIVQHVCFVKGMGTCGSGERNVIFCYWFSEVSQIFPHFALKSTEREIKSPCFYYVWLALHKTTRYDYNLTIMKSAKPATDNRFKK
jgi:hypothetical protein